MARRGGDTWDTYEMRSGGDDDDEVMSGKYCCSGAMGKMEDDEGSQRAIRLAQG